MRQTLSRGVFAAAAATGILSLYGAPALADSEAVGTAEDSPGTLSGNNVQVPVDVPVNVCGNTIGAGALNEATGNLCANTSHSSSSSDSNDGSGTGGARAVGGTEDSPGTASGNTIQVPVNAPLNVCGNTVDVIGAMNESSDNTCVNSSGGGGSSSGDDGSSAVGVVEESGGEGSGNLIQLPIELPVNACGNSIGALGVLSNSEHNHCENATFEPDEPEEETPAPPVDEDEPPADDEDEPPADDEDEPGPPLAETGSNILAASAAGTGMLLSGVVLYRRGRAATRR